VWIVANARLLNCISHLGTTPFTTITMALVRLMVSSVRAYQLGNGMSSGSSRRSHGTSGTPRTPRNAGGNRRTATASLQQQQCPFRTLGLDKVTATPPDVKAAFRHLALQVHPDKNTAPSSAHEFGAVRAAYEKALATFDSPAHRSRAHSAGASYRGHESSPTRTAAPAANCPGTPRAGGRRSAQGPSLDEKMREWDRMWHEKSQEMQKEASRAYREQRDRQPRSAKPSNPDMSPRAEPYSPPRGGGTGECRSPNGHRTPNRTQSRRVPITPGQSVFADVYDSFKRDLSFKRTHLVPRQVHSEAKRSACLHHALLARSRALSISEHTARERILRVEEKVMRAVLLHERESFGRTQLRAWHRSSLGRLATSLQAAILSAKAEEDTCLWGIPSAWASPLSPARHQAGGCAAEHQRGTHSSRCSSSSAELSHEESNTATPVQSPYHSSAAGAPRHCKRVPFAPPTTKLPEHRIPRR
jgi:curved DNA-binding protein CbpA